jgi:hypothetical protein
MARARCTPKKHKQAAAHRRAQAKYVARHPDRHKRAVSKYQSSNRPKINQRKRDARKAGNVDETHRRGRPREC